MSSFGSHGDADYYVVTNADEVDRLIARDVDKAEFVAFRNELDSAARYERDPATRARLNLAMLYLADGDLEKLREARALADHDWRDLLVAAEYPTGHRDRDREAIARWRDRQGPASPKR